MTSLFDWVSQKAGAMVLVAILAPKRNRRIPHRKTYYALIAFAATLLIPCALLRLGYAEPLEGAASQESETLSPVERSRLRWEIADEFRKAMKGNRFEEAVACFTPELKKELPAAVLEKLWRKLVDTYDGEFHLGRISHLKRFGKDWFQCIDYHLSKFYLEVRLAFDDENKINGLWVVCDKGRRKPFDIQGKNYMFGDVVKKAEKANLSLKAIAVGLAGKPIEKRNPSIWMAVEREVDNRRDFHWHDPVTGKLWRRIGGGEVKNLSPGLYRAVVLPPRYSNAPPPIGMSDVVELDGSQKHTEIMVPMKTGPTLSLKCVDAKTGEPSVPVHITVTNKSSHLPPDTRFGVNERVSSLKLENMPPGTYAIEANIRVFRPDEPQYRLENEPMEIKVIAGHDQEITLPIIKALMTEEAIAKRWRWVVKGQVTDEKGQPIEGASVWVHSGIGTCFRTGITETGKDGRYTLRFSSGARIGSEKPGEVPIGQLVASVSVHKPGFTEKNLSRQGGRSMANRAPTPEEEKRGASAHWGKTPPILPNDPVTIDFVMVPAATLDIELVDAEGKPVSVTEKSLGLSGETRSPGCSILKYGENAGDGRFRVEDVPPDYAWWVYLHTKSKTKLRTPEMTFSPSEKYRVKLQFTKRASDEEYLEVVSVKNAQGEDVREQVLAGESPTTLLPSSEKPAPPELVEKLLETNRPWLTPHRNPLLKHLSYTFSMEHPGEEDKIEYTVKYSAPGRVDVQKVGSPEKLGYSKIAVMQGVSMFGPLHSLALSPSDTHSITVAGEETINGVDAWVLHLKKTPTDKDKSVNADTRFHVAAGCGLARTWYGFSSYKVDLDQIWVDKSTGRILREEAFVKKDGFYKSKPSFVATYNDFTKRSDGGQVPRNVEVTLDGSWVFQMEFQLVGQKAWLLKELKLSQGNQKNVAVATVSDASIAKIVVGDPALAKFEVKLAKTYQPLPNDEHLNEMQVLYCRWDAKQFGVPDAKYWEKFSKAERADAEKRFLELLKDPSEAERVRAIDALVGLGCKKAVTPILKIAAERREKNNWDRHTACRALGMLGDQSVVPELVHLTYHFNWNTRHWAQISLTRLTGQNYGNDIKAWQRWWNRQDGQPPISTKPVAWATSQRMLQMLNGLDDPKKQKEHDEKMIPMMKRRVGKE